MKILSIPRSKIIMPWNVYYVMWGLKSLLHKESQFFYQTAILSILRLVFHLPISFLILKVTFIRENEIMSYR